MNPSNNLEMGSFLDRPMTEKHSGDRKDDKVKYGYSSMQGWRINQEDAHNCILNYDKGTSFFAVYDGHGGQDVSEYCSQKLPEFLKNSPAYKEGDVENALIEGFLEFDRRMCTPEVVAELKQLVCDSDEDDESDLDENVDNLYEEASMPIEEVLQKYRSKKKVEEGIIDQSETKKGVSSSSGSFSSEVGCSSSSTEKIRLVAKDEGSSSSGANKAQGLETLESKLKMEEKIADSSAQSSSDAKEVSKMHGSSGSVMTNGEISENNSKGSCSSSTTQENNGIIKKGKAIIKKGVQLVKKKEMPTRHAGSTELYKSLLLESSGSDEDSEDDDDESFEGPILIDSSDDDEDSMNPHLEDDSDEESAEESSEEEEEEDEHGHSESEPHIPGYNSGSTAIVALLRENDLYVANIGDSRCVVCREGKAVAMSEDHKPQDAAELQRIMKAGGVVNNNRVNDDLNLSRAFGDFSYKQNEELSERQQMVIALPDIKKMTIEPGKDEFMVLACDGIWDCMDNQDVIDFLRPKILDCDADEKLSKVAERLLDLCLAPTCHNVSAGTDNMTAVIVKFKSDKHSKKRSLSPAPNSKEAKVQKLEEDKGSNVGSTS